MKKCEVLADCSLVVNKGSVVIVSDMQFELARHLLKPVEDETEDETEEKPKRKSKK